MNQDFVVVREKISRKWEPTKISIKYGKRPVLLENLEGNRAIINLWADRDRIYKELGVDRKKFLELYSKAVDTPSELIEGEKKFSIKGHIEDVPVNWYYEKDAGYYITSGIYVAEYQGKRNISIHRTLVRNDGTGLVRLVPRDLFRMYNESVSHGEELKVSIVIGSPLEFLLASATSVEYGLDESRIAASLYKEFKGKEMKFAKSRYGILVPSESDIVINAKLTSKKEREGPFKDVTGTYDIQENQPQIIFEDVEFSPDWIYHSLVPATYEHFNLMGLPREPTIFKKIRERNVDVLDVRLTEGGASWLHGIVKIKKKSEDDFKNAVNGAFEGHKSMKRVIVVDDDIDIYDDRDVEWAEATRFQADRGIIIRRERGSSLDPSISPDGTTSKMGIDATKPLNAGPKFNKD